jgi:dUTP pyrophosphatase
MNRLIFVARKPLPPDVFPRRKTNSSAGIDLFSLEKREIPSQSRALINTGWEVTLPPNTYGQITDVSSLTLLTGVHVINSVIDEDYHGEIRVLLSNPTQVSIILQPYTKVAQLIVTPYCNHQPAVITNALRSHISFMSAQSPVGFGHASSTEADSPNPVLNLSTNSIPDSNETWSWSSNGGSQTSDQALPGQSTSEDAVPARFNADPTESTATTPTGRDGTEPAMGLCAHNPA